MLGWVNCPKWLERVYLYIWGAYHKWLKELEFPENHKFYCLNWLKECVLMYFMVTVIDVWGIWNSQKMISFTVWNDSKCLLMYFKVTVIGVWRICNSWKMISFTVWNDSKCVLMYFMVTVIGVWGIGNSRKMMSFTVWNDSKSVLMYFRVTVIGVWRNWNSQETICLHTKHTRRSYT